MLFFKNTPMVTFVIPTIARRTLINTIKSLKIQTNSNWNAIVIYDGNSEQKQLFVEEVCNDYRIKVLATNKIIGIRDRNKDNTFRGAAGLVRNIGIREANGIWVGFVDDDDTLHESYVEWLTEYDCDIVVFKMKYHNGSVIPNTDELKAGSVGISFAVKSKLIKTNDIEFINNCSEDYIFLKKCISFGKYIISDKVAYFVG